MTDPTPPPDPAPTPAADEHTTGEPAATATPDPAAQVVPAVPDPGAPPAADPFPTGYTNQGVPTLDYVRDKIEGRYATSLGTTELAEESAAGRDVADQEAERAKKAAEKLAEIRRSLGR